MHTGATVAKTFPPVVFALQKCVCSLADAPKCLAFGELGAAMKICLRGTPFTHYFMHHFAIKTNKELEKLFPLRRELAFFPFLPTR